MKLNYLWTPRLKRCLHMALGKGENQELSPHSPRLFTWSRPQKTYLTTGIRRHIIMFGFLFYWHSFLFCWASLCEAILGDCNFWIRSLLDFYTVIQPQRLKDWFCKLQDLASGQFSSSSWAFPNDTAVSRVKNVEHLFRQALLCCVASQN